MPFPLAHPAAVLPLKRYCPRRLNFPALVIGSLSPDAGYCFGNSDFSHTFFPGSFAFCLPVGLLMLACFYALRWPLVAILPGRLKQAFLPSCQRPVGSLFLIVPSLLIGAWTHIFLDSLTHSDGWMVGHLLFLQKPVPLMWTGGIKGYEALYLGCTFFGVAWVAICYWGWLATAAGSPTLAKPWVRRGFSILFAVVILCAAAASRGQRRLIGDLPLAIITLVLMIAFLAGTAAPLLTAPANKSKNAR